MAASKKSVVRVGGRELKLSNLDKVLFPRDRITKGDLIAYYTDVAKWLLPHVQNRPLTLQRFPDGIDGPSFFEKQKPKFTPAWIPTARTAAAYSQTRAKEIDYLLCNDLATLTWCANLAAIVLHVWYSRVETIEHPDFALFDLDPWEGCTLKTLGTVALGFRDVLTEVGLEPLVKSSGGSGLHVVVPLTAAYDYETIKRFGQIVAERVAAELPELTTFERTTARRPSGVVYLDYVQVGRGKTVVPPYVVRARDGAPVSMPLDWDEVEELARKRGADTERAFGRWTIRNAPQRLEREGDLWGGKRWKEAKLEGALRRARTLWEME